MSEVSVLRKHLINYAKTKDVFAAYKASGYNREFYEAHRDTLALRSAAKKAFDAYKKENGSDKKLPRISELNTEYAMLLERKKSSYAEYRKTKSEMQDWLVAQKIVQEILKEDEQKKEQLHEQELPLKHPERMRSSMPQAAFYGDWGVSPTSRKSLSCHESPACRRVDSKKSFKIWKNFRLILFVSWSRI